MTQDALFTVATLGFEERERSIFRDTFRVTEYRVPTFRTHTKESGALPHIVIVNADRPDAVARWESFRRANEGKGRLSLVMMSSKSPATSSKYELARPTVLSEMFSLLERVVLEEHGYQRSAASVIGQSLFVISPDELPNARPTAEPLSAASAAIAPPPPDPVSTPASTDARSSNEVVEIAVIMEPPARDNPEIALVLEAPPNSVIIDSGPADMSAAPEAIRQAFIALPFPPPAVREPSPSRLLAKFLVVDDSLPVRIQMKVALQSFAKTIDFAHSGEEAMFLIDNCKYDIIFLDVILPGKDGYEVCRYIRSHAMQRETPVIMLTGNSSAADRVKGKLAGCDTYLVKPVRASVLTELINEYTQSTAVA